MGVYRFTGQFYTAPDRGSPNGHWYAIGPLEFSAESDEVAQQCVQAYLQKEYSYASREPDEFKDLKLIQVQEREVDLTKILTTA